MCHSYSCCFYYYALLYSTSYYCHNGGTCQYNGTQYVCLCTQGWDPATGCQTEINKDPCDDTNTGELQNLELRNSSTPNVGLCDKNLPEKWYKAYGYEMITHDPGSDRCGSKNPIYLTGSIPNDTDIHNLTACLRDQDNACTTNLSVLVKKCDADTIFYLSPTPTCNSTYCFDQVDMSDKATTWTPSSMHISFKMTWSNTVTPEPGIVYRCNFRFSTGNLWYKIKWYINDIKVAESEYVQKDSVGIAENTILTEKYIETYGVTIKCSVTAAYGTVSPPGVETKSPGFYAGMKLHTPLISIERGKSGTIIMEPTIPYGCPNYTENYVCKTRILMSDPQARNQCDKSQIVITSTQNNRCGLEMEGGLITNTKWFENELWRKNYTLTVKHREEDQRYIPRKTSYILELKFENRSVANHPTWSLSYLENVVVNVYETETWMNKKCYAVIDPHLRTFDGRNYEMQMEGIFVLYKHTERNATVIIKTTSCWKPGIFCVCGIVVQAGKDIFVINTCPGSIPMMRFYRCNEGLLRVYSHGEHLYKIYLPTGTRVEAHLRNYGTKYWDIYIYPTNIDVGNTLGLCGTLDNYCGNDFVLRNGSYSITAGAKNPCSMSNRWLWYPNDFSNSWRITDNENLFPGPNFDQVYNALSSWSTSLRLCYCPYNSKENDTNTKQLVNEAHCSYKEYADCDYDPGKEKICRHYQSRSLRFKRSDAIFTYIGKLKQQDITVLQKRSATMSRVDAETACNNVFNESVSYQSCLDIDLIDEAVLELCIQDLMATNDLSVAYSHRERGKSECTDLLSRNDTLRQEHSDIVTLIQANNCPNECSYHGSCAAGNCMCETGFSAKDCSMNLTAGININGNSDNGFCDKSEGLCVEIEMYGEAFPEDIHPISRFTPFTQGYENGRKIFYPSVNIQGEQQSLFSAIFNYPSTASWSKPATSNTSYVYGYSFAVSVYENIFSEESTVYILDSTCQLYQNTADSIVFSMKKNYCFINGVCLYNGTVNPAQTCKFCNAAKKKFEWSDFPECVILSEASEENKNQGWVIAVITVVLLVIVLIITIAIAVKKYSNKRTERNSIGDFRALSDKTDKEVKPKFCSSRLFVTEGMNQKQDYYWCNLDISIKGTINQTREQFDIIQE